MKPKSAIKPYPANHFRSNTLVVHADNYAKLEAELAVARAHIARLEAQCSSANQQSMKSAQQWQEELAGETSIQAIEAIQRDARLAENRACALIAEQYAVQFKEPVNSTICNDIRLDIKARQAGFKTPNKN